MRRQIQGQIEQRDDSHRAVRASASTGQTSEPRTVPCATTSCLPHVLFSAFTHAEASVFLLQPAQPSPPGQKTGVRDARAKDPVGRQLTSPADRPMQRHPRPRLWRVRERPHSFQQGGIFDHVRHQSHRWDSASAGVFQSPCKRINLVVPRKSVMLAMEISCG